MNRPVHGTTLRSTRPALRHLLTVVLATALSLTGLVALSVAAAPSASAAAGTISGKVTASGTTTPLPGMTVVAFCEELGDWYWCDDTLTGADGTYALDLPDGTYRIGAYSDDNQYAAAFHGGTDRADATDVVPPATGIDLQMAKNASVRGKAVQGVLNLPVADIGVCLYEEVTYDGEAWWECISFAYTAANGSYTVWAPPGTYRVGFSSDDNQWRETYYSNASTVETASGVVVSSAGATGINAKLVRNGKVTGTVRDAASNTGIAAAMVTAYELVEDEEGSYWAETFGTSADGNGAYSIFLPPGTYRFEFGSGCDETACADTHTREFWNDKADVESADDVTLAGNGTVSAINASLERNGRITGTVLEEDGGEAVPGAEVSAMKEVTEEFDGETVTYWEPVSWAQADEDGSYELFVPNGTYRVAFDDSCFETCDDVFQTEFWEEAADVESADDVVVAGAGVVAGKNATLARNGAITGNVTAEADGASLEGVDVLALQEDTFEVDGTTYTEWMPVGFASTDENGDYSLPVAAGTYRVGFFDYCWAEEECRHLTEFYDDVSTPEAGTDVTVTGSDVTPDIDAALAEGSTVSGTITDGDDAPVEDAEVTAYVEEDGEWTPVGGTWTDGNGDYRLLVADGSYRLGFSDPAEESFTEEFYDDSRTLEDADTIVVGGADVADVDATVGLLVPVENLAPPRVLDEDPQVGELVYAHPGVWTPASDDLDIEWFRSGSEEPIGSGIGVVVPAEALGETLTVEVTVRADDRIDGVASSEPSAPVTEGQLTSTVKPSVRGPLVAGATVEARDGSWSAAPDSYTYRWFQSGTDEPIGTDKQLVVPDGAVGQTLTVEVTAKKAGYADGVRSSEPTVAVTAAPTALEGTAPPRITGVVQVGRTITVDPGTWSQEPSGFHYQWWADGKVIPGVTGADYTVPAAMANKRIQVMVTAGVPGAIGTAWTEATTPVALGRITAERPRLTGKPKAGRKLRVRPAAAVPAAASVRVQWLVNGSVVPGATRPRLKLTRKHQGKRIRAQVVYSLPGYAPLVWRSAKVRIGR